MIIQHNMLASNTNRMYGLNNLGLKKAAEKLSSGYQVNRSADDAAGLAISEVMRRQVRGLSQASANAQDGISMVQAAEGALHEAHDMLHRMNELCVKAANDTMTYEDREYVQSEITHSIAELDRLSDIATFNGINMLGGDNGDITKPFKAKLQIGAESDQYVELELNSINATTLGVKNINVLDNDGSGAASGIDAVKEAIKRNSEERSKLGAVHNRLTHSVKNLDNVVENTTAAESKIRDTDMAKEMVSYSIRNIFSQASVSLSAQANQSNSGVLGLLS